MAKTTWKVISYYEGTQTVQEILECLEMTCGGGE